MSGRYIGRRRCADFRDRLAKQSLDALLVGPIPPGDGHTAAALERAPAFGDRGLGPGKIAQAEIAPGRIKGVVGKRQVVDLSPPEIDGWMRAPRQRDHSRLQIDA